MFCWHLVSLVVLGFIGSLGYFGRFLRVWQYQHRRRRNNGTRNSRWNSSRSRGSGVNNSNRRKTDKGSNDGRHYLIYFISPWIFYCE